MRPFRTRRRTWIRCRPRSTSPQVSAIILRDPKAGLDEHLQEQAPLAGRGGDQARELVLGQRLHLHAVGVGALDGDTDAGSGVLADQPVLDGGRQARLHRRERETYRILGDAASSDVPDQSADVSRGDRGERIRPRYGIASCSSRLR